MKKYKNDIIDLSKNFSIKLFLFVRHSPCQIQDKHIINQILRSSSSIAANCIEARYATTKKDLYYRYKIALREAKETEYWFEFLNIIYTEKKLKINEFEANLEEIIAILFATVKKIKQSLK